MAYTGEVQLKDVASRGADKLNEAVEKSMRNFLTSESFKETLRLNVVETFGYLIAKRMEAQGIQPLGQLYSKGSQLVKNVKLAALEKGSDVVEEDQDLEKAWLNLADTEIDEARAMGLGEKHGTHTILCVDTSGSMNEGDAWLHVKQFYNGFLDGLEKLKEMDVHYDNIALVTFGHETKVQQRLTKDLARLRGKLDNITPTGPSPMFGGLVLAGAAAKTSKFSFAMVNYLHVTPKIILVTDGRPTELELSSENRKDIADSTKLQQTKKAILREVEKLRAEQIDLHCIYVGRNADRSFLRQLQNETIDELMSYRDGEKMAMYTLLKCKNEGDQRFVRNVSDEDAWQPQTQGAAPDLLTMMGMLQMGTTPPKKATKELFEEDDDDFQGTTAPTIAFVGDRLLNVYHENKDKSKFPPVGTRVKRGRNWRWGNQDQGKAGTIIGHEDGDKGQCWVHVEWDHDSKIKGFQNVYRFKMNEDMEEDVTITGEDREPPKGKVLAVGCKVKPGKGFAGETKVKEGVVIRFQGNQAEVKWNDGSRGYYRYGSPTSEIVPLMDPDRTIDPTTAKEIPTLVKKGEPTVKVTEKKVANIAETIGVNWRLLGIELGINNVNLDRIEGDNSTMAMKILAMLNTWRRTEENPMFGELVRAIKSCGADYNRDRLEEIIEDVRKECP